MKKIFKGPIVYIVILGLIFLLAYSFGVFDTSNAATLGYKEFMQKVEAGEITDIYVQSDNQVFALAENSPYTEKDLPKKCDYYTHVPSVFQFDNDLKDIEGATNVTDISLNVIYHPAPERSFFVEILPIILVAVVLGVLYFFIMRQAQGGSKGMNFGKSRARMTMGEATGKTFADVAGADEEKEELSELVDFLKDPKRFTKYGARVPKGVLLVGPPGTGKTLMAKAVAGEAKVPFFSISGSDFVEMFVGVGASRVRDLFENAKKNAPSIVFIDEIDAVGRQRGAGLGGGHDEREQTLNQLLVEMDGFQVNQGVIIIAATNRVDILDPALLRAGRFDRQVYVGHPDVVGREEILKVHAKGKPFADDVDMSVLAKRTPGFTGADLENVLNEAAILAARRKKEKITMEEIEEAVTKVIAGPEKRSRKVTEKDQRCTAYHEVGHAICARELENCDSVHEISIVSRGMAAGYTLTLPDTDDRHVFRSKMKDEMAMLLGGRAAEALVLGDISTGASNDIQRCTAIAKDMVVKYGMSDKLGPVFHGDDQEVFLGRELGHTRNYSESVAQRIDDEVTSLVGEAFDRAKSILSANMDKLHSVTAVLIEREKLTGEEFERLMKGEALDKLEAAEQAPEATTEATTEE